MNQSGTYTTSYTVTDVRKVFSCFRADLYMIAQSSRALTQSYAETWANDVLLWAESKYIDAVNIILHGATGNIIRAKKYERVDVFLDGDRPGDCIWPQTPDGRLSIVVETNSAWKQLSDEQKEKFYSHLAEKWGTTNFDTSFPGLNSEVDRTYSSNGYGLKRTSYWS